MTIFSILTPQSDRGEEATHLGRFKRIANISLWISLISTAVFLFIAFYIDIPNTGYLENISSLVVSRQNMDLVLLLTGLLLVVLTATATWLITLYCSFRVVGPLYRFSRNLEVGASEGTIPLIRIRDTDYLKEECQLLRESVTSLYSYYGELENQLQALEKSLLDENEDESSRLFAEIQTQIKRIRLDAQ